jgi:hypothetical protein
MNTNEVESAMLERVMKRQEQWATVYQSKLPDIATLNETTLIGSYSYSLVSSRIRIVRDKDLIPVGELKLKEAPSTAARDYLNIQYKRGPIVKHLQAVSIMDGLNSMPNYAKPSRFAHGFYVDIKSAYWSIMGISGWNVDYYPGKWLSAGRPPFDFPYPGHKISRNCLVSAGLKGGITRYMPPGTLDVIKPGGNLTNMSLPKLISDVLNCIAFDAVQMGAVYVNTDGYIAPDEKTAAKIIGLITDWGLVASIKGEGEGGVKSSGAYKVGDNSSLPWNRRVRDQGVNVVRLPSYSGWLQKSFTYWKGKIK